MQAKDHQPIYEDSLHIRLRYKYSLPVFVKHFFSKRLHLSITAERYHSSLCPNEQCDYMKLLGSEEESSYAMPRWGIGWDVFCWNGQRRFSRHWSVPQIRNELKDSYDIQLSDDAIEDHIALYQIMVAARHQDHQELAGVYHDNQKSRFGDRRAAA